MKIPKLAICFLSLSCALCFHANARTYTDDMDDTNINNIKQYSGLSPYTHNRAPAGLPDRTVFVFSNTSQPHGWAQYRVQEATGVVAGIYSHCGTFVSQMPDDPSVHTMGVFQDNMDFLNSRPFQQALFSAGSNAIYTNSGGLKQVYHTRAYYQFGPVITPPTSELIGYGVNIYYSMDGHAFTRAQANQTKLIYDTMQMYFYEEYSASVPSSAKYIRVEINDITSAPLTTGGYVNKEQKLFTSLASVTLSGENLMLGEPEPIIEEPFTPNPQAGARARAVEADEEESVPVKKEDSSVSSKEAIRPEPSLADSSASSSKSSSSSKFEGTITSSSKSSRASSAKASGNNAESGSQAEDAPKSSAAEPSEAPDDETIVYEISRGESDSRFEAAIVGYIIIVSGAIGLVVVLPKHK